MWWRIYYDTGVFDSSEGDAWEAPRVGVQVIAYQSPQCGYELFSGFDYYYFEPERRGFYGADMWTIYDHLMRAKRPLVLFGRMITDEEFSAIAQRATEELPEKKTAWRRGERRD